METVLEIRSRSRVLAVRLAQKIYKCILNCVKIVILQFYTIINYDILLITLCVCR